ncbi:nucleolar protein 9 isoform X4 [Podarcis raffonei]|uniref:nucleolar protein 9 isoform X4 n=1 Tax=Podarcis raffonei TaxID=65483 RepID=UPI0023297BFE|nr:nucleolar protein 9 isoform X4 [Podarcis raffonei]
MVFSLSFQLRCSQKLNRQVCVLRRPCSPAMGVPPQPQKGAQKKEERKRTLPASSSKEGRPKENKREPASSTQEGQPKENKREPASSTQEGQPKENKREPASSTQERGPKESKREPLPKLEPAAAEYFRRAHETLKSGFDSDEEKALFVSNVLVEAEAVALPLALDTAGSLLLQALLPSASAPSLSRLLRAFLPALRLAACHPCGAHILEAALLRAPVLISEGAEDAEELEDQVLELARAMQEELPTFAQDIHASFVVRTLLQVLGGVRVRSDGGRGLPGSGSSFSRAKKAKLESDGPSEFEVPETFQSLLGEFKGSFQEHIPSFITNKYFSLCLQVALEVLHRKLPADCSELCHSMIGYLSSRNVSPGQSPLLVFLKDATCSRVLDKVLEVSDRKALLSFYKAHMKGQLHVLAAHKVANFTLQRLIQAASRKLLGKILGELGPGVEEILACEHLGLITALLGACRKYGSHQQEVLQLLMEAFHCWEPPSRQTACVPLIASVLAYEVYYGQDDDEENTPQEEEEDPSQQQAGPSRPLSSISYHGSLMLQHLLHFANPSAVLRSLAAMTPDDLVTLARDPAGSHVFDALLASPSVPEKQRRKVLRRLKGCYVTLACSKHGSRVLDAIWNRATLPAKREMAQELAEHESRLQNDPFGHFLVRNFSLTHFLKRRQDWERHHKAKKKRRELFSEILED